MMAMMMFVLTAITGIAANSATTTTSTTTTTIAAGTKTLSSFQVRLLLLTIRLVLLGTLSLIYFDFNRVPLTCMTFFLFVLGSCFPF